jgi:hypothetical protein
MSESAGKPAGGKALELRLSVPASGRLRAMAAEFATRVAAHLGSDSTADAAGAACEHLAERVAPDGSEGDITFEFTEGDGELLIRARCNGRSSETRHPLPE